MQMPRVNIKKDESAIVFHADGSFTAYMTSETDEHGFAVQSAVLSASVLKLLSDPDRVQDLVDELDAYVEPDHSAQN